MSDETTTDELLERAAARELDAAEQARIDALLAERPELRARLALERELRAAFGGDAEVAELRDTLHAVAAERELDGTRELGAEAPAASSHGRHAGRPRLSARRGGGVRRLRRALALAASLLVLAVAGWWVVAGGGGDRPEDLYAAYAEPYGLTVTARAAGAETLDEAMALSAAGDFTAAGERFALLSAAEPDNVLLRFYAGHSALFAGDAAAAVTRLTPLLGEPPHAFREQARWYLALAHLRLGDVSDARATLELIEPGTYRYAEAQEVLGRLEP